MYNNANTNDKNNLRIDSIVFMHTSYNTDLSSSWVGDVSRFVQGIRAGVRFCCTQHIVHCVRRLMGHHCNNRWCLGCETR